MPVWLNPAVGADLFEEGREPLFAPEPSQPKPEQEPLFAEEARPEPWLPKIGGQMGLEYRFFHDHGEDRGMDYHHNFSL